MWQFKLPHSPKRQSTLTYVPCSQAISLGVNQPELKEPLEAFLPSLKRRWVFHPTAKRLSESRIRAVAQNGLSANQKPVLASVVKGQESSKWNRSQKDLDLLLTDRKTGVSIR
jgi:hypothetical protein